MDTDTFRTQVHTEFPNACFLVNSYGNRFPSYKSWSCEFELPEVTWTIHCAQTSDWCDWSITLTLSRSNLKFKGQGTTLQEAIRNTQDHMEDSFTRWREAFHISTGE